MLKSIVLAGLLVSVVLTLAIYLVSRTLAFDTTTQTQTGFIYRTYLKNPTYWSRFTCWLGYIMHQLYVWMIIFIVRRMSPQWSPSFRWWNWALFCGNLVFSIWHIVQTKYFYDGLAQDVSEYFALGGLVLMLTVILAFESPRRGLFFGHLRFDRRFVKILWEYHGYFFSWVNVFVFWYHPCDGTFGDLVGFFYMFMLFG